MAGVSAVAAVISAVVGVYSAYEQKRAASKAASIQEEQAEAAEKKTKYDVELHRERVKKFLSSQKALYGKSGLALKGSPLLVLQDTERQAKLDEMAIRLGGDVNAATYQSQANLLRQQGRTAFAAGALQAGTSLLTKYSDYKTKKAV